MESLTFFNWINIIYLFNNVWFGGEEVEGVSKCSFKAIYMEKGEMFSHNNCARLFYDVKL